MLISFFDLIILIFLFQANECFETMNNIRYNSLCSEEISDMVRGNIFLNFYVNIFFTDACLFVKN